MLTHLNNHDDPEHPLSIFTIQTFLIFHSSSSKKKAIFKKLLTYALYIQTGLIAQALLQYLCATFPKTVWECFGSWMRTIRDDISPSEQVTSNALRHSLPEFLKDSSDDSNFKKFMKQKIDINRSDGIKFAS